MARRIGAIGTPESMALLVDELGRAAALGATRCRSWPGSRKRCAVGGRWRCRRRGPTCFAKLAADADRQVRSRAMALALTFGDPAARRRCGAILADASARLAPRQEALAALLKVKDPALAATFRRLSAIPALGGPAVRGLSAYDDPATPGRPDRGVRVARPPSVATP